MSVSGFARLVIHQPLTGRRAYSSFFSSKSGGGGGGGRYFNSAKQPKVIVPSKKVETAVAEASKTDAAQTAVATSAATTQSKAIIATGKEAPQSSSPPSPHSSTPPPSSNPNSTIEIPNVGTQSMNSPDLGFATPRQHPIVSAKDFKLNQFFSLHRPLLLLSNPPSVLESSPTSTFDPEQLKKDAETENTKTTWLLDELSQVPMDADADAAAARQLSRALTMHHAGAAVAWEDTLRRLGLDLDKEVERVQMKEQMDKEWEDVMMDSTKRKRRKKMKKHKLKKRRKLTRSTRLKLGR